MRSKNDDTKAAPTEKNSKKKGPGILWLILILVCLAVFVVSGARIFKYYFEAWRAERSIASLDNLVIADADTGTQDAAAGAAAAVDQEKIREILNSKKAYMNIDEETLYRSRYLRLFEENSDFIGWVSIPGTKLNYPVMYTPDEPQRYLHLNFSKQYEYSGLPFVDGACSFNPDSTNIIIYGHNMKSDTMFSRMMDYKDASFAKEHPYIYFNTLFSDNTYEIVAVILSKAYYEDEVGFRYYEFIDADNEAAFNEYMENIHALELYDTGVDAQYGDQLLTLSTCEYSQENGRMAIIAKKVQTSGTAVK